MSDPESWVSPEDRRLMEEDRTFLGVSFAVQSDDGKWHRVDPMKVRINGCRPTKKAALR